MLIQWFPGHMTAALRMMEKEIKICDAVVYVLDSRCAISSINPKFAEVIGGKPILFVLNKQDLSSDKILEYFKKHNNLPGTVAVQLNSTVSHASKTLQQKVWQLLDDKVQKAKLKGITKTIRLLVLGVPNSGKSTLINNLCGKGKTITGNRPGVTRGKQWVRIGPNCEVMDTPGTLWPSFSNNQVAKNLAYVGSIKDDILNVEELAENLLLDIAKLPGNLLAERYKAFDLESICKQRGLLLKGGVPDILRCARAVLDDFRSGKLGKINLDLLLEGSNAQ